MRDARRPSVWPVASITYHSRCASPASLVSQELFWVVIMGVLLEARSCTRPRNACQVRSPNGWVLRSPSMLRWHEADQLDREAGDELDVGVERLDLGAVDLQAE